MATPARVATLLGLIVAAAAVSNQRSSVTPLQKVIDMLDDVLAKGKQEKHDEKVEYAKFSQWCDSVKAAKEKGIAEAAAKITQLEADIAKAVSDAKVLADEVKEHEGIVAKSKAEKGSATKIRKAEKGDYDLSHRDFSESIDACARAVQVLKARGKDVPQSLIQLSNSNLLAQNEKAVIDSFLAMQDEADGAAPEANAYEFQSGSVVAMLEKLKLKFEDQRLALQKEEMNAKANYEVLAQHLLDDMEYNEKAAQEKTAMRAGRLEDAAEARADKDITERSKAEDEKTLEDTNQQCLARSLEFEKNQETRADEIKAITEATAILRSGAVTGNADTYLPASLVQATSFAQIRSNAQDDSLVRERIVEFLQRRVAQTGSRYLAVVAARAASDPFVKVKAMIKDLIFKLMEQANAEADQHAYCETELATNKQTRDIKSTEVDELSANIDELTAKSAMLASDITALSDAIAELTGQQAEATKTRGEEKAIAKQTVADATEAQVAVEAAIKVLRDYYNNAKEASLVQGGEELRQEMSQASNAPYHGMQASSGGIFGMLEVVLSDFARLEAETTTGEDAAQTAFEKFIDESNETLAVKNTELKHNEGRKQAADDKNQALQKERELTQGELDAALEYYEKLKDECVKTKLSYEDRKKSRAEEIQSLTEALRILNNQDLSA